MAEVCGYRPDGTIHMPAYSHAPRWQGNRFISDEEMGKLFRYLDHSTIRARLLGACSGAGKSCPLRV
ncbi:MAG: hypothetical protein ABIR00_08315 [Nitrosospira sp.]